MATEPFFPKTSSHLPHYVFVFPNFFSTEPDILGTLNKEITAQKFTTMYNSIFKIMEENNSGEMVDTSGISRNQDKNVLNRMLKKPRDREFSKSFQVIKDSRDNLLRDISNGMVQWGRALKLIFENLMFVFEKDLFLEFDLFYSRDKDEIFVKLRATETNLRIQADLIDYQVQVAISRPRPDIPSNDESHFPKQGFSLVSPYGEFQYKAVPESELFSIYKAFTPEEKKAGTVEDAHSVFRYKDKVKLITAMITSVVDLGELLENQIITSNFCVHNEEQREYLRSEWGSFAKFYKPQHFQYIRRYFGEKISMYFAYLEYYICWLIVPSLIGLSAYVVGAIDKKMYQYDDSLDLYELLLLGFSLFLSIGSTLLDQLWIRRENKLAWMWGTTDLVEIEQQRPAFKGEYMTDPITGIKKKIQRSKGWERVKRSIGFSITFCFTVSVLSLIIFLTTAKRDYKDYTTLLSLANAMQIKVMNFVHRIIARKMTEWENYEYDSEFNNALTVKLYLFQFINSYSSLFYIAFFKDKDMCISGSVTGNCMKELQEQLFWILIFNTFMNLFELGFPYIKLKIAMFRENSRIQQQQNSSHTCSVKKLSSIESQSKLAVYETPLDDYMELIINYGYVVMFSVACPLFPLFSLLLNILEVRVDAYKLCYLCQRPYPTPANSIGTWISIIRTVSIIGALTNTAILVFTADVFDIKIEGTHNYKNGQMWMNFVLLEHVLLFIKYVLLIGLENEPRIVKEGLIWSKRIAAEKIYGKASNLEHQREIRGLKFESPQHYEHFVLKPDRIKEGDFK